MRLVVLFLILAILPFPALAERPLVFRNNLKDAREQTVLGLLKSKAGFVDELPYTLASVDLNSDGVDEWIFRQDRESGCEPNASCTYIIAGISEGKPVILGNISARKIGIADQKIYGVNRLYVYNKKENDFVYSLYGWSPETRSFQPL